MPHTTEGNVMNINDFAVMLEAAKKANPDLEIRVYFEPEGVEVESYEVTDSGPLPYGRLRWKHYSTESGFAETFKQDYGIK